MCNSLLIIFEFGVVSYKQVLESDADQNRIRRKVVPVVIFSIWPFAIHAEI